MKSFDELLQEEIDKKVKELEERLRKEEEERWGRMMKILEESSTQNTTKGIEYYIDPYYGVPR
jgi:hypothetical protein